MNTNYRRILPGSELTPMHLYNAVSALLKTHVGKSEREAIFDKYRKDDSSPATEKLWETKSVQSGLENFVTDYFFGDFKEKMPWLRKILTENREFPPLASKEYFEDSGPLEDKAKTEISELYEAFKKRYELFIAAHRGLKDIKDVDKEALANTMDSFGHLLMYLITTESVLKDLSENQS